MHCTAGSARLRWPLRHRLTRSRSECCWWAPIYRHQRLRGRQWGCSHFVLLAPTGKHACPAREVSMYILLYENTSCLFLRSKLPLHNAILRSLPPPPHSLCAVAGRKSYMVLKTTAVLAPANSARGLRANLLRPVESIDFVIVDHGFSVDSDRTCWG